ncbi:eCIS core domain-containing protein [Aureibacter tunicatorum]|uniref:eCIS core domain-containing protein n=1 Tax=Aureibacter tunicatorum TaxID=866807 RepID=A0AAE3XU22_9BACT|nr:DUF4157 domain-containing protein [Aureibacter tunicatorum]MDR6241699.1 hypothetical protein [Aureibacter tunicatorum]BDD07316.1 hypothetical protein AUTU_47990 [Aureibacter tunicatorum]
MTYLPLQHRNTHAHRALQRKRCLSPGCNGTASVNDRRPEAVSQMKVANTANSSKSSSSGKVIQNMIDTSPRLTMQAKFNEDFIGFDGGSMDMPVQRAAMPRKNSTGLPDGVLQKMESYFNHDFSDVRFHKNSSTASSIGALAFAQGNDVHVAQGFFNPSTSRGQQLIGHELAHVVQQKQGLVRANSSINGLPLNDQPHLERAADMHGLKASMHSF